MGLGLMVAELSRDLEKQVERELEAQYEKSRLESERFAREYEEELERQLQEDYRRYNCYNETINHDSIIKAEKQFTSIAEKLSNELNKNIHMLQTHKPVVNLNLTINIMGCENSEETADAVESRVVKLVDILK